MPASCSTCRYWTPGKSGEMAKHGFAVCALGPKWHFLSPTHTCQRHQQASPEVVAKRGKWLGFPPTSPDAPVTGTTAPEVSLSLSSASTAAAGPTRRASGKSGPSRQAESPAR